MFSIILICYNTLRLVTPLCKKNSNETHNLSIVKHLFKLSFFFDLKQIQLD